MTCRLHIPAQPLVFYHSAFSEHVMPSAGTSPDDGSLQPQCHRPGVTVAAFRPHMQQPEGRPNIPNFFPSWTSSLSRGNERTAQWVGKPRSPSTLLGASSADWCGLGRCPGQWLGHTKPQNRGGEGAMIRREDRLLPRGKRFTFRLRRCVLEGGFFLHAEGESVHRDGNRPESR
jgi:hypothetical protein